MQNKQQEFLKQREKLKYVIQNKVANKVLDPDIMIEQLISDKETFKLNVETQSHYVLPKWLKVQNNLVPALYEQVWQVVKLKPLYQYCDTKIITQLFTTSGLSLEKLGYLWSLVNVSSPGFLTQQELYVMLALIALVQTGYQVKDISIIKNINHPILPQLNYSFLNISVANPSINRSSIKNIHDSKLTSSIIYNGVPDTNVSNTVPLYVKPIVNLPGVEYSEKNLFCSPQSSKSEISIQSNCETECNNLSTNRANFDNTRKSEMDVAFLMPEKKNADTKFCLEKSVTELDVDFPTSRIQSSVTSNIIIPETKMGEENLNFVAPLTNKSNPDQILKINIFQKPDFNFLNTNEISSNKEPRSLDLPVFSENVTSLDEEEFTEFQSASIVPIEEYSDFQSASPIVKYELDHLDKHFELKFNTNVDNFKAELQESDLMNDESFSHKTSIEADKYDVFRALVESKNETTSETTEGDCEDEEDEEDEEEEFGEFFAADTKPSQVQEHISIKEKCLKACLKILQEGLDIFLNISKEETIKEVLHDEKGCRYFNQLKIIYETSQRFQRQFENVHLSDTLQLTWEKLSKYTKYLPNDELLDEIPSEEDIDASPCKLCETKCDINCVRYAGNNYHVTCINLFLHFVEDSEITAMLNF